MFRFFLSFSPLDFIFRGSVDGLCEASWHGKPCQCQYQEDSEKKQYGFGFYQDKMSRGTKRTELERKVLDFGMGTKTMKENYAKKGAERYCSRSLGEGNPGNICTICIVSV